MFYSPEDRASLELTADIILDKNLIEVFIDGGAYSCSMKRQPVSGNTEGWYFKSRDDKLEIKSLKGYPLKSIWE